MAQWHSSKVMKWVQFPSPPQMIRRVGLRARSKKRQELLDRKARGEMLEDRDKRWLYRFKKSSEWRNKVDIADDLVREIIFLRDTECITCGVTRATTTLQVGHLISRGVHSVRWDLKNCNGQCPGCNQKHENYPEYYFSAFVQKYGAAALEDLQMRAHQQLAKYNIDEIISDLRRELYRLKK